MNRFKPIKFPKDQGQHKTSLEWWYFNGHLSGNNGREYSFMDCLFRVNPHTSKAGSSFLKRLMPRHSIYFAHHVLSDIKAQKNHTTIKPFCIVSKDSFKKHKLDVRYAQPLDSLQDNFSEITETMPNQFRIRNENIDLRLKATKKPLLEGGNGFVQLNDETSYYYSLTNLETRGSITIKGKEIKVAGKSWFDHQWSDPIHSSAGWTWFSIQLKNNVELVCFLCTEGNSLTKLAGIIEADGKTMHTKKIEFIEIGKHWRSPETKAAYPINWRIKIPQYKTDILVKPLIKGQEVLYGFINYWEGPIAVKGNYKGKKVSGQGFLELVGYPFEVSRLKLIEKEPADLIRKRY